MKTLLLLGMYALMVGVRLRDGIRHTSTAEYQPAEVYQLIAFERYQRVLNYH